MLLIEGWLMMSNKYPFPKFDLHCHLDGSLVAETIYQLAIERGIEVPGGTLAGYQQYMKDTILVKDFYEYLARFDFPTKVLQDVDSLTQVSYSLVKHLASLGVVYCEIRFAPQLHTKKGLSQMEVTKAVLSGVKQAMDEMDIEVGIICCAMNFGDANINRVENLETVDVVAKFLNKGVVLLDLAGAEGSNDMADYRDIFDKANSLGVPFTVHAGEGGGAGHVAVALGFRPKRIGHGVNAINDLALMQELIAKGIGLEVCITSNIQCHIRETYGEHPIKQQLDMGALVTINTDNMAMANTTLDDEYDHLINECGFTYNDVIRCNMNSVKVSCLNEDRKVFWVKELSKYLS